GHGPDCRADATLGEVLALLANRCRGCRVYRPTPLGTALGLRLRLLGRRFEPGTTWTGVTRRPPVPLGSIVSRPATHDSSSSFRRKKTLGRLAVSSTLLRRHPGRNQTAQQMDSETKYNLIFDLH
uniref:Secreted protein n=1 Tax=Macrostomum lignano TaxID=282301 RepID=A0A1I8FFQ2_9PLAT